MPRLHSLELLPDADGEAACRRDWQALRDAGLPSMLDHTGGTNTPHVTVLAMPAVDAALEQRAVDLLGPLLPLVVRTSGVAVLGHDKVTLARLLDVDDALVRAVLELRAATTGQAHQGWLPHLTLVRRLPRADLARALDAVDADDLEVPLAALRRWDPEAGEVTALTGGPVTPRERRAPG